MPRTTRHAVKQLLKHGAELDTPTCPLQTVEDAGVWPDCIRGLGGRFAYTAPWHYQNISICAAFDPAEHCPDGNCVSAQIPRQAAILADTARPAAERVQALAFLIHFVGDLHQPLHIGDEGDRGGNDVPVDYFGNAGPRENLHHIWDTELAEAALRHHPHRKGSRAERSAWQRTDITDWARESWTAAKTTGYAGLHVPDGCAVPAGAERPRAVIDRAYVAAARPVVRSRIKQGGARLAAMLEQALPPQR